MKKRLSFIIVLIIAIGISAILGFEEIPTTKINADNLGETKVVEKNIQILSAEDKAVKTEIAKYSDTNIDFRFKKQLFLNKKNYDLTFSRMGCITSADITSNVTYANDKGDEVSYDLDTGRMTMAYFPSLETQKSKQSVNVIAAEQIANDYASKNCDIDKYVLETKEERDNGYMFSYCKYIYGYRTNDRVRVLVGFDGAIVSATIRFYAIDDENIRVNKEWFEQQIRDLEEKNQSVVIEDLWIERERNSDKIYFNIKCKMFDMYGNVSASVMLTEIKE